MFPEPLLRRVYDTLAPQCGWPVIVNIETPELEDAKKKRDLLKTHERTLKNLGNLIADTDDAGSLEALHASVRVVEGKMSILRAELGDTPATSQA